MRMKAAITGTEVVLTYGTAIALNRSSFTIPKGSLTAVIGPNGSGKSTLLNGISGLLEPRAGSIEIHDGARVSYVLQATKVNEALPVTVREIVGMGLYPATGTFRRMSAEQRAEIDRAMETVGITHLQDEHLHSLSGGQRQRVFLAQGIVQPHEILLLDEPLTGLDITSAQAIDEIVHATNAAGCTVVMTTHDLAEASTADYVVLLSKRVIAHGLPDEVLTAGNLTEAYGQNVVHVEDGGLFIDDPAHVPVEGRHVHHGRTVPTDDA
jgi:manganese transport system ATP-binding protein